MSDVVKRELRVRAYLDGFGEGAGSKTYHTRHVVEPATHIDFRRGFEEGRKAREEQEKQYRAQLVLGWNNDVA